MVTKERVAIPLPDGPPMGGYLARPDGPGDHPGVVVAMELFGVDAHVRDVCDELAARGFTALAPDFYHRIEPGVECPRTEAGRAHGFELLPQLTRDGVLTDAGAALNHLRTLGAEPVGMVGLSLGGHLAYLAATGHRIPVTVVFYGGWLTGTEIAVSRPEPTLALTPKIAGRLIYIVGENDHVVTPAHREEIAAALAEAGDRHRFVVQPGEGHSFLGSSPEAAEQALGLVESLFREELDS